MCKNQTKVHILWEYAYFWDSLEDGTQMERIQKISQIKSNVLNVKYESDQRKGDSTG